MATPDYAQGEVLLALLVFSDGQGAKRRPVLVVQDSDLDNVRSMLAGLFARILK